MTAQLLHSMNSDGDKVGTASANRRVAQTHCTEIGSLPIHRCRYSIKILSTYLNKIYYRFVNAQGLCVS